MSGDLIRLINRSKLVERSLFAIIDLLLQGAKSILLYLYGVWGDKFLKKSSNVRNFFVSTFDTKVTECLCSRWVFFSSDKFRLFN